VAISIDYGKCDKCGENNVKTAKICRACKVELPWARVAAKPKQSVNIDISMGYSKGFYLQIVGGIVFVVGAGLWIGNKTGLLPTVSGLGMITCFIGSALWGTGAAMDNHGADD
jgi:hypothetical protein